MNLAQYIRMVFEVGANHIFDLIKLSGTLHVPMNEIDDVRHQLLIVRMSLDILAEIGTKKSVAEFLKW